jgi:hypothetical protein
MTTPLRSVLATGVACVATLLLALPAPASADNAGSWFGGKATQGSGNVVAQTRALNDFQVIKVSGSMHVRIRQAASEAVEVRVDDNLLPLLETVIESTSDGRTLHVRWKRGENVRLRGEPVVSIDVVKLTAVSSQGSGDITIETLVTPALSVALAGSGDARLKAVSADELTIRVSGSGDVRGDGKAQRLKIAIAGSGDVQLTDLLADSVSISIAGSGDAAVHADKALSVSIAGSGYVVYGGAATAVTSKVVGNGSIQRRP